MSDLRDQPDGGEQDLAAEYAVGVLSGAERRAAERRMREDGPFAASVAWWESRLAPLYSDIRPVEAPAHVWDGISADIDRIAHVGSNYRSRLREDRQTKGIRSVSPLWRTLAGASSLLAVASLAALAILMPPGGFGSSGLTGDEVLAARLATEGGETLFTVVVDLGSQTATLVPVDGVDDPSRVPELWLIEEQAPGPRSLGLLEAGQPLTLQLQDVGEDAPGSTLAISLEPEGGSPTGAPTGPVIATGGLDRL